SIDRYAPPRRGRLSSSSQCGTRIVSMKSAVGLNVKGIGTDARETAREAARRAGVSVGEWLNTVIADAAGDIPSGYRGERREATGFSAIHGHLDELAARLGRSNPGGRS